MDITKETRLESYLALEPNKRQKMIIECLDRPKTARQIAIELGFVDLNAIKPRICELKEKGIVRACGKALDMATGRNVAIYELVEVENEN